MSKTEIKVDGCLVIIGTAIVLLGAIIITGMVTGTLKDLLHFIQQLP